MWQPARLFWLDAYSCKQISDELMSLVLGSELMREERFGDRLAYGTAWTEARERILEDHLDVAAGLSQFMRRHRHQFFPG